MNEMARWKEQALKKGQKWLEQTLKMARKSCNGEQIRSYFGEE